MRGILILLGLVLAGAVAFLVVWPRLVDEPALRGELARLLRRAGVSDLQMQGAVRLELLPLPRVSIERVVFGDRTWVGPGTRFEADRIDVEVAPLALLAGRLEPSRVQLIRPHVQLAGSSADVVAALLRGLGDSDLVGLRQIEVIDGALVVDSAESTAWPRSVESLDLSATRQEGAGFRLEASAAVAGEPMRIVLEGAPLALDAPVSLDLQLGAGPRDAAVELDFHGHLLPANDATRLDGAVRVDAQHRPLPPWILPTLGLTGLELPVLPWALQGRLSLEPGAAKLSELELALPGGQLRGDLELGSDRAFELSLDASMFTMTPELVQAVVDLSTAPLPDGWAGRVDLRLANLVWRDEQVRGLRAELVLPPGGFPELRRLDANLPGATVLQWVGSGQGTDELPLAGALTLQAGEVRRLLGWLGVEPGDLPPGGLSSLDLSAAAGVGRGRLRLAELQARLDATQLQGSLGFTAGARPRLDLALTADRLNTALYATGLSAGWTAWRDRLAAIDGNIELTIDRLTRDVLRGEGFRLMAGLDNGRLTLGELRLADLGGAALQLRGTADLGRESYALAGEARLAQAKPFLRLLEIEPPADLDRLSPLRLQAGLQGGPEAARIDLELAAAGASAALHGSLGGALDGSVADLGMTVGAADMAALLQALGWPAPADRPALGRLDTRLELRRDGGPIRLATRTTVGSSELTGQVAVTLGGARPQVDGAMRASSLDTGLLSALYETMAIPLGFPPGRPWLWPGNWPRQPLRWQWLHAVDLGLQLDVARLRHRGTDLPGGAMTVTLQDGGLALSRIASPIAGGTLQGTVTLEETSGYGVLGADLRLTGARADELAATLAPGSGLSGNIDVTAELGTEGSSVADLIGSLRGEGGIAFRDGRLADLDPRSAGGASDPPRPALTSQGPFTITRGVLESPPPGMELALGATQAKLDLSFDLLAWILDARVTATSPGSTQPFGPVRFFGPPGRAQPLPAAP